MERRRAPIAEYTFAPAVQASGMGLGSNSLATPILEAPLFVSILSCFLLMIYRNISTYGLSFGNKGALAFY